MELIFNPCGEFRRRLEGPVGKSTLFTSTSGLLGSSQMLQREWNAESNGKLPHLFIPSKTATLVSEFAMKSLPLDITANLVPAFAVKNCPWAENSDDDPM